MPMTTSTPWRFSRWPSCNISYVLPTPATKPRYTLSSPRFCCRIIVRKCSGAGRGSSLGTTPSVGQQPRVPSSPRLWGRGENKRDQNISVARRLLTPNRQRQAKHGADAGSSFTGNGAAVRVHDLTNDGQSQARAVPPALAGNTEKPLKNVRQMLLRDPDAGIGHRHGDFVIVT